MKSKYINISNNFIILLQYLAGTLLLSLSVSVFNSSAQNAKTWQWARQIGGPSWDISAGLITDTKNNIYVAGSYYTTLKAGKQELKSEGDQDIFIARLDEKGNIKDLWGAGGKNRDQATCIASGPDNQIVVGGSFSEGATFGKIVIQGGTKQLFVALLNEKGKFKWVQTLQYTGEAYFSLLDTDSTGNIYVTGTFNSTLEGLGQKVTSNGRNDIFLARLNATGTIEKIVSYGGPENDTPGALCITREGDLTISGTYTKPFAMDSLTLSIPRKEAKINLFIARFNNLLKPQWVNILGAEENSIITGIKNNKEGHLYAAGSFSDRLWLSDTMLISRGYTDAFITKYDEDGKMQWSRSAGSWYYDNITHLNIDNLGGAVITGSMGDTLAIDSIAICPGTKNAALIMQFSPEGQAIWGDCISGTGTNFSTGAVLDNYGNLYFTGSFRNTFEKGSDDLTSNGDEDVFVARYFNCMTNKAEVFGATTLCPGTTTELSVKSGFKNVVWNNTTKAKYIHVTSPGRYWVSMLDKRGCLLTDTLDVTLAPLPVFTLGNDTMLRTDKNLLLKAPGHFARYTWHDHTTDSTYLVSPVNEKAGNYECWLTVSDSIGCTFSDTIQITYVNDFNWFDSDAKLTVFPNPVNDWLTWSLQSRKTCKMVIELTDNSGKIVYNQYVERYDPGRQMQIYMGNVSSGVYFVSLKNTDTGASTKTIRVVKQ